MYFKVTDASMRSVYSEYQGKYAVQYRLGEFVRPIAGRLFVYDLSDVRYHGFGEYNKYNRNHMNERRLWLCECINPTRGSTSICCYDEVESLYSDSELLMYLESQIIAQADAVKLVEEITLDHFRKLCFRSGAMK